MLNNFSAQALHEQQRMAAYRRADVPSMPRLLDVVKKTAIGEGLTRITLSGPELQGFPVRSEGSHIKLFIPQAHQVWPIMPTLSEKGVRWPRVEEKPIVRTYSVRAYRESEQELDIEFVNHCPKSPASGWAQRASIGSKIGIAGPGGPNPILNPASWSLLAGDLSALPAISALLECGAIAGEAKVLIELDSMDQRIGLYPTTKIDVQWVRRIPGQQALLKAVQQVDIPLGVSLSGFIAGESTFVVAARKYLCDQFGFTKSNLYAVPYWRRGQNEEAYHADRHEIMDEKY